VTRTTIGATNRALYDAAALAAVIAYRVCKVRHAPEDGSGAARVGGRWNSPGRPVIYCGMSQAGAMLEILANANRMKLPGPHHVATFIIPADVAMETVSAGDAPQWDEPGSDTARSIGDAWLARAEAAVLLVPSAIARPYERSVVINPAHPDFARLTMTAAQAVTWDARLFAP
jgi:RES domain-containing protein